MIFAARRRQTGRRPRRPLSLSLRPTDQTADHITDVTLKSRSGRSFTAFSAASGDTTAHTLAPGARVASSASPKALRVVPYERMSGCS
eukprot:31044-Pelagococcus_subviridis.AAC.6